MNPAAPAAGALRTRLQHGWRRFLLAHALQILPLLILLGSPHPSAAWLAGILGSVICCLATDSGWRWRNRYLILLAAFWLLWPLSTM